MNEGYEIKEDYVGAKEATKEEVNEETDEKAKEEVKEEEKEDPEEEPKIRIMEEVEEEMKEEFKEEEGSAKAAEFSIMRLGLHPALLSHHNLYATAVPNGALHFDVGDAARAWERFHTEIVSGKIAFKGHHGMYLKVTFTSFFSSFLPSLYSNILLFIKAHEDESWSVSGRRDSEDFTIHCCFDIEFEDEFFFIKSHLHKYLRVLPTEINKWTGQRGETRTASNTERTEWERFRIA